MARKSEQTNLLDSEIQEQDGTLFFHCNRPLSIQEYHNLVYKVQMEEERTGRRIIIVPHAVDVVKS